ncbi:hypothetical protein F0P96_07380 [Hymenobacter busanensis]|uniref:Uncharacterized protein n=1 Tax=Hymenobacter busanensis TaxID=2607656 RepID=A0A7L5A157_9BACT|nr:hypothetical protein [Hymenobacter busanensis]KAA9338637.1 hypothetical protein F0P96_07380 [Hymenobacter busanensis]QHJ08933.1 hypothetical protein GUY19_17220 [Hymenobacter busanensis]
MIDFPRMGRSTMVRCLLAALVLVCCTSVPPAHAVTPSAQVRVARQFLLAVLRADYAAAYAFLAPEVRTAVTPARFQAAAQPLYAQGQRFQSPIDLYKLGVRLHDDQQARMFYAFMFRSDTTAKVPQVQLDVTFRDSAATGILNFTLVPAARPTAEPGPPIR